MHTTARDKALLDEIAAYFETLAYDCETFIARGIGSKTLNKHRAQAFRDAASDVRSIKLVEVSA